MAKENQTKKVCIIGAGAAGCACAWLLSQHSDKYQVELWEKGHVAGGVASSHKIDQNGLD
ncbi:flavin-containing amine oxidasedehydrogenase [Brachionus plicatilis]|uniref:Flavin-containing amine oxidasedehydrogenase n=1 Tax=Brachionus plicatilis TaxID=10195 RepID=A0A3M7T2E8_BRAPC|nr:flavin-containing amine oxidasedehydrogenase [Brachionus plicatilis]